MGRVDAPGAGWCGSRVVADSRPLLIAGSSPETAGDEQREKRLRKRELVNKFAPGYSVGCRQTRPAKLCEVVPSGNRMRGATRPASPEQELVARYRTSHPRKADPSPARIRSPLG